MIFKRIGEWLRNRLLPEAGAVLFFRSGNSRPIVVDFHRVIVSKRGLLVDDDEGYRLLYSWDKIDHIDIDIAQVFLKRHQFENMKRVQEIIHGEKKE